MTVIGLKCQANEIFEKVFKRVTETWYIILNKLSKVLI